MDNIDKMVELLDTDRPLTSMDCLKHMLEASMVNRAELSRRMGKSRSYISSTLQHTNDLKTSTLVELANAMGYTVQVVGHGETITLKPKE